MFIPPKENHLLTFYDPENKQLASWQKGQTIPDHTAWFDLRDPSADEVATVEYATGLKMPTREQISGIGVSSRNRKRNGAVYLHMPVYIDVKDDAPSSPLGIVLARKILVTLHYHASKTVARVSEQLDGCEQAPGSCDIFATIGEVITDRMAESMEDIAADLVHLSDEVFVTHRLRTKALRELMLHVGQLEARLARTRSSLLGFRRLIFTVCDHHPSWLPEDEHVRLKMIQHDLGMLDQFDEQLTDKLAFLLDAILGFINTDQNEVMKLLTVASVATIPPVVLAGIWGMNFKYMPELSWPWGYPLALATIALSIIIPLLWFKSKGWLSDD
ncbi:CorA family divalent cation transporter [Rhodanobacter sp. L36]|uniref:CorA family divalent cation transporter n=1 Tax=Rhodanobacter sp. L36 TaxID=1747221 RepID=UPI00131AF1CB|nr:CorA family divalent cation transporter [Rhodanobacter sp. L36]